MKLILTIKPLKGTTNRKGPSPHHPNVLEFTRATKSSSLIKNSFDTVLQHYSDCWRTGRLTRAVMQVMHSDTISNWGKRSLRNGDLGLLTGYNFNERNPLGRLLMHKVCATINPVTGLCLITLPSLVPEHDLHYAGSYTHVRFTAAAGCFDFEEGESNTSITRTAYLDKTAPVAIDLMAGVPVQDGCPMLLLLGVEFFQFVNDRYYRMCHAGGLSLQVVAVERGVAEAG